MTILHVDVIPRHSPNTQSSFLVNFSFYFPFVAYFLLWFSAPVWKGRLSQSAGVLLYLLRDLGRVAVDQA